MKEKIVKKMLIMALFFTCLFAIAQNNPKEHSYYRECSLTYHKKALATNPKYATSFYKRKAKFEKTLKRIHQKKLRGTHKTSGTLYIPVAVHFETGSESDRACLEEYAQTQIDVINADYTATNSDINLWQAASQYYPGLQPGVLDVKFCIATKNHPQGADPEVQEGSPLVTIGSNGSNFGASFPENDPTYAGYMNFIIKDAGEGTLGYSPLLGSIADAHAVVMSTMCFGTGAGCGNIVPQSPYNLGRTVTHELGHFYNLNHTFEGGCNGTDDAISDTPATPQATYGNPTNGSVEGCSSGEYALTMNYMDYVDDTAMYMFTPDQVTVMEAYFETVKNDFKTDVLDCIGPSFSIQVNNISDCDSDIVEATIQLTPSNGFNETTTFSIDNLPTGVTYSFSPTTLTGSGSTTLTLTGFDSTPNEIYTINIVGTSDTITKTKVVVLDCQGPTFNVDAKNMSFCNNDETSTVVNYTTIKNFSETTTFSIDNLPAGVTYSFSPSSLSEQGSTTLTLSGLSNLNQTPFDVNVVATASTQTKNTSFNISKINGYCDGLIEVDTFFSTAAITQVLFNEINHTSSSVNSGPDSGTGYSDLTATQSTTLEGGGTYNLSIRVDADWFQNYTIAWIDWNQNCEFEIEERYNMGVSEDDWGECYNVLTKNSPLAITVPQNALNGETVMRVITDDMEQPKACGQNNYGEIEDYKIIVTNNELSIKNNSFKEFSVYPNPTKNKLNVSLSTHDDVKISIFDITGRCVYSKTHRNNQSSFKTIIDIENLTSGTYTLTVNSNRKLANKKIVLKK